MQKLAALCERCYCISKLLRYSFTPLTITAAAATTWNIKFPRFSKIYKKCSQLLEWAKLLARWWTFCACWCIKLCCCWCILWCRLFWAKMESKFSNGSKANAFPKDPADKSSSSHKLSKLKKLSPNPNLLSCFFPPPCLRRWKPKEN